MADTIRKITASDIADRHPWLMRCNTDQEYAELANAIYDTYHEELGFMETDENIMNVCVGLALYFEDIHSGTHLFETFAKLYHQMYGRYVPFYDSMDENSPEAELDAVNFVLWLVIAAERGNNVANPLNSGIRQMAREVLLLWHERKDGIHPNEELADYLYCEETQSVAIEVRKVLTWIENKCFLGRWYNNYNYEDDEFQIWEFFRGGTDDQKRYAHDCLGAFEHQAWPLSLKASHIYAEMIRLEMNDDDDEIAAQIDKIEFEPLGAYQIVKHNSRGVILRDFKGKEFLLEGLSIGAMKSSRQCSHVISSFFKYDGHWEMNGMSAWKDIDGKIYTQYAEGQRERWSYYHDYVGQYEDFVKAHDGERLFFFKDTKEISKWIETQLHQNPADIISEDAPRNTPLMLFFEPNGQMTFTLNPQCVSHKGNKYYDRAYAGQEGMCLVAQPESASPDLTMYIIEHDLLKDVCFNDFRGQEHGRKLLQENIDFVARCMRRDITTTVVRRKRTDYVFNDVDIPNKDYASKYTFPKFVKLVAQEKSIRSSANKEWRVMKCDTITTVVKDVANKIEYSFSTKNLHNAHIALGEKEIQIASLVPYVGKECAPAAAVVLYNLVGKGREMNTFRQFANILFKNLKK